MASIQERINSRGEKSYKVQIRLNGYKPLTKTFQRKTDAREWAAQTESDMKRGRYFEMAESERHTLADLINRYIQYEVPKRKSDQNKVTMQLRWWQQEIGHLLLKNVRPSILAEMRDKLLSSPIERNKNSNKKAPSSQTKGPATVIRYMASLSHAFTVAVREWGWLSSNPMTKVSRPELPQERVRFLSNDERIRLLKACEESSSPFLLTAVVIALSTGGRYSEITNLKWDDIDLTRELAVLNKTKNKERRALPIKGRALQLLSELYRTRRRIDSPYVFPRQDGQAPINMRKHFERAVKAAEVENFRFHDLRHSAASYLAMSGSSNREIAEVLGHKTLQMVKRYAHLSDEHSASVVERMNKKFIS